MTRQLTEFENQLEYMQEVDPVAGPFSELAAGSIGLVGDGLVWGSEFTGSVGELVDAVRDMGSGGSFTDVWGSAQDLADLVSEASSIRTATGRSRRLYARWRTIARPRRPQTRRGCSTTR